MTRREQLYPEIRRLREDEGLKWREIAARLGLALPTVRDYYKDPDGAKVRARKAKNNGVCIDCGAETRDGGAKVPPLRCRQHAAKAAGAERKVWTREAIVAAIREWAEIHGEHPRVCDWNPTHARIRNRRLHPAYINEPDRWPHQHTVMREFGQPGGWERAIRAAGFEPRARGSHGSRPVAA